ncbi:MAG: membrane protein of unknown function [Promethearchaeota archaeon]|nr:MAG: membrane protein of unknown function [Candidatus Lokiarchaeota archaeon]
MIVSLILFIGILGSSCLLFYILIQASLKSRHTAPILSKIFLSLVLFVFYVLEFSAIRFLIELGMVERVNYDQYRYVFDIFLGMIGFHVIIDLKVFEDHKNLLWKSLNFLIGTNLITAVFILTLFLPSIRTNTIGFLFLLNTDVEFSVQILLAISKLYGLGGFSFYLIQLCLLLYKSNLYKKSTLILLFGSILAFIDALITIPVLDVLFDLGGNFVLAAWLVTNLFLIAARLNRISFKIFLDIKGIIFVLNSGLPLFALSNKELDSHLVGGALVGINAILQEISGSKKNKINSIDQGENKLLFAFGDYCFVMLMSAKESELLLSMIKVLLTKFESQYKASLKNFKGDTSTFNSAKNLVDDVFSNIKWREPLEIK